MNNDDVKNAAILITDFIDNHFKNEEKHQKILKSIAALKVAYVCATEAAKELGLNVHVHIKF